jgi:hypothetical protein
MWSQAVIKKQHALAFSMRVCKSSACEEDALLRYQTLKETSGENCAQPAPQKSDF